MFVLDGEIWWGLWMVVSGGALMAMDVAISKRESSRMAHTPGPPIPTIFMAPKIHSAKNQGITTLRN